MNTESKYDQPTGQAPQFLGTFELPPEIPESVRRYFMERAKPVHHHRLWKGRLYKSRNPKIDSEGTPSNEARRIAVMLAGQSLLRTDVVLPPTCGMQLCVAASHLQVRSKAQRDAQPGYGGLR